ncbi:recombinase family protein [Peptostreptococcus sp. D1]|uniref:recombinase family protein n=1 Tax=Peptostreptococcus sp. D1 TaxID=72304 RepID=UPI0008DFE166|nr:recombinase family protein [Peptostreptococcus sp. D1]SFE37926.1 Site-specific DNA recombinase [Peptostreptococcus sp. D1]
MDELNRIHENITVIQPRRVIKDYAVGIYARVSTNRKEQMESLSTQVSGLTRLAVAHRTWFVADIFLDVASAKTGTSRIEFNRMISECEKGNIDIILTKSISRFGRDTQECLEAIRKIRAAGKRIIFERDKIDTEAIGDELLISVIEACEQSENEWRSENIRWGLKRKAENGTSGLYNRPCYGYKKDKYGMLVIDDEQAKVVRDIFNWYLEGCSIGGIIKRLETNGIKSPKGKERWSKKGIESTLTRQKYTGDVAIADSGGSENQYLNKEHHEGIISKEQFEAVQLEMESRSNVEVLEDGTVRRKNKKYSSKRGK